MRRRDVIGLVVSFFVAGAWPVRGFGQLQKPKRIGFLFSLLEADPQTADYVEAFREGLAKQGWAEGRNLSVDYRFSGGSTEASGRFARELVNLAPDILVGVSAPNTLALAEVGGKTPIVFALVPDPVSLGLVKSLARPGGNITGFTNLEPTVGSKWLELLAEVTPNVKRAALMFNPETAPGRGAFFYESFEAAAKSKGIVPFKAEVRSTADISAALQGLAALPDSGLVVTTDGAFLLNNRAFVVSEVNRLRLPAVYPHVLFAGEGAMVTYAIDPFDVTRRAADYVGLILNGGASPADLPIQAPDKYQLIVNLKTAKMLGITVPPSVLIRADQVIE